MSEHDVATAVEWAAAEGWNPGLHDARCFRAADPNGFLIGKLGGQVIATISVIKYDASFGFLGLYIVKPTHRGQGYGRQLWNAGLAYLRGCTIGLDGVVAQQANYRRSGFTLAYRNVRYRGASSEVARNDRRIVPLSSLAFEMLNAYDRTIFPADRTAFLRCWIDQPRSAALALFEKRPTCWLWHHPGRARRSQDRAALLRRSRGGGCTLQRVGGDRPERRRRVPGCARNQSGSGRPCKAPCDGAGVRNGADVRGRRTRRADASSIRRHDIRAWINRSASRFAHFTQGAP